MEDKATSPEKVMVTALVTLKVFWDVYHFFAEQYSQVLAVFRKKVNNVSKISFFFITE